MLGKRKYEVLYFLSLLFAGQTYVIRVQDEDDVDGGDVCWNPRFEDLLSSSTRSSQLTYCSSLPACPPSLRTRYTTLVLPGESFQNDDKVYRCSSKT